jgi:hypothetical protein
LMPISARLVQMACAVRLLEICQWWPHATIILQEMLWGFQFGDMDSLCQLTPFDYALKISCLKYVSISQESQNHCMFPAIVSVIQLQYGDSHVYLDDGIDSSSRLVTPIKSFKDPLTHRTHLIAPSL